MPPAVRAAPSQGLNKWSRPAAPSTRISVQSSESRPSLVPPAVRAPQRLNKWARTVAPPSNSKPSEVSILNSESQLSIAPLPTLKVSHPKKKPTSLSPGTDHANSSPTLLKDPHRTISAAPPQRLNKWSRPAAPLPSKLLVLQSANNPLSKKKQSSVPKLFKASRMDVFIPSTISVAALAKLLNVKLGTYSLAWHEGRYLLISKRSTFTTTNETSGYGIRIQL